MWPRSMGGLRARRQAPRGGRGSVRGRGRIRRGGRSRRSGARTSGSQASAPSAWAAIASTQQHARDRQDEAGHGPVEGADRTALVNCANESLNIPASARRHRSAPSKVNAAPGRQDSAATDPATGPPPGSLDGADVGSAVAGDALAPGGRRRARVAGVTTAPLAPGVRVDGRRRWSRPARRSVRASGTASAAGGGVAVGRASAVAVGAAAGVGVGGRRRRSESGSVSGRRRGLVSGVGVGSGSASASGPASGAGVGVGCRRREIVTCDGLGQVQCRSCNRACWKASAVQV